jgi:predicted Zn-dependent peptidase
MYERKTLASGLNVVCEEIPYVRSVSFGILVRVGSRHESKDQLGISHLIEHMLFKGSEKRSYYDIAEQFDMMGTHLDAFTGREYTCIYVKMVDNFLPNVLELVSDIMLKSSFNAEDLKKEKNVILEEIKMNLDNPEDCVFEAFMGDIFRGHPLGNPILGTNESINSFSRDDICGFYNKNYVPSNTIVSVAGNIKSGEIFKMIEKYFGFWEGEKSVNKIIKPECNFEESAIEKDLKQMYVCLGTEGVKYLSSDRFSFVILNDILGGSMSSHLFQEVREKRGLAYSIGSIYENYVDTGVFIVYANTDSSKYKDLIDVTYEEFEKIKKGGITDKELLKAKEQIKGAIILSLENTSNRMTRLLKEEFFGEKHTIMEDIISGIEKITKDDVIEVANRFLKAERLKKVSYGPKIK